MPETRTASCNCGAIRIEVRGQPMRVGLCHCTTCRKASGAPFTASGIWRTEDVTVNGGTASWKDSSVARHFCPSCGCQLFGAFDGGVAIGLGAFDAAPTDLVPTYELFTRRRERWFQVATETEMFVGHRTAVG